MMADQFTAALNELEDSGDLTESFGAHFVQLFPVTGAAVSTVGDILGSETLSATDDIAARLDELQFDLSDGPCWEAIRTAAAVIEPDFRRYGGARWPAFAAAVEDHGIASMFAFPLTVGDLRIGAVDLYSVKQVTLSPHESTHATAMAEVIGRHVLRGALVGGSDHEERTNPYSRRIIHQATGMILAQLDIGSDDALLMIQARAFTSGQRMMDVAEAVIQGRLRYARMDGWIEVRP